MKQVKDILHKNDLVHTSCREGIMQVIASSTIPLSEDEIKARVRGDFYRTTFYRTFKILITKGIIHKIVKMCFACHKLSGNIRNCPIYTNP